MGTILYEIICCSEWKEEKEDLAPLMTLPTSPQRILSYFHPSHYLQSKTISLEEEVTWMKSLGPLWQYSATYDGKIIAILQHSSIETRSSKDNYASALGKNTVIKDPYPNFRCMAWSRDSSLLAVSFTNGLIVFYDIMASQMFTVKRHSLPSQEESSTSIFSLENILSGLFFAEERVKKSTYCNELISVDTKGLIKCFRQTNADQMTFHHEASIRRYYPRGVNVATYLESHALLLVCGSLEVKGSSDEQEPSIVYGVTIWRLINDTPHYRIIFNIPHNEFRMDSRGMWKLAFTALKSGSGKSQDAIFKVSVSPDGKYIAALHITGKISVWHLPSLKIYRMWHLNDQHQYNTENTRFNNRWRNAFNRSRSVPIDSWRFHPCDINWWNEQSIIISRVNGCVSICSLEEHIPSKNLLGESPELFESPVPVTSKFDREFFALECDIRLKDDRKDSVAGLVGIDVDSHESNFRLKTIAQEIMFWLTDSEAFRPPRKRKRKTPVWKESFRLYSLRSITPLELFHRKIELEEYGEALDLARLYKLDPDLVYQRQWTRNPVSVHSIRDYLSKIQKRNWVLQECLERVPENIDAARELLQFGLKGTDLSAVVIISQGKDKGKFILWSPDDLDISQEEYMLLVDTDNLEVKRILSYRKKFLFFLDVLDTYEQMLGGPIPAEENFDGQVYGKLRSRTPAESAIEMAQNSDISGLRILLTNHWNEITFHYFVILSSFPETASPHDYRDFLPEIELNGYVLMWNEIATKEKDWCDEIINASNATNLTSDSEPTVQIVTSWYEKRIREIELYSGMVNFASDLARLGLQRNVDGLQSLMEDLEILENLVYEIKIEDITLEQLEDLSDIERVELLMSSVTDDTFVNHFRQFIIPFLKKREAKEQGAMFYLMNKYLTSLCKDDLKNVLKVFEKSKLGNPDPLITPVSDVMRLAFSCIYACTAPSQSSNILAILNCLPERNRGLINDPLKEYHDDIDDLERHYQSVQILEKYEIFMTLKQILDLEVSQENEIKITEFFENICQKAIKKSPPMKQNDWKMLLLDILDIQKKTLKEYRYENCYEIYVDAVLRSGNADVISLSREFLDKTPPVVSPTDNRKLSRSSSSAYSTTFSLYLHLIPYEKSLEMILNAATLYFDSACNYTDPDMELSKLCLNLMQNLKEDRIAEMFDLIDAVKLLNKDFQLQILPQSVRNHPDRLKLIKLAMENTRGGYKKIQQLLKLGICLRIDDVDVQKMESLVLDMVGDAALEEADMKFCVQICQNIMAKGYQLGWKVFTQLAKFQSDPPVVDNEMRLILISYALNMCPDDQIFEVLNSKYLIEIRSLQNRLTELSPNENSVEAAILENQEEDSIVQGTLNKIKFKEFVQTTTKWINPLKEMAKVVTTGSEALLKGAQSLQRFNRDSRMENPLIGAEDEETNSDFIKESYPAFYISEEEQFSRFIHSSILSFKYDSFSNASTAIYTHAHPALELCIALNRIWHLEKLLLGAEDAGKPDENVLEQLLVEILPEDLPWGFAVFQSIENPDSLSNILSKFPSTPVALTVILYFLSFKISLTSDSFECGGGENEKNVYIIDPNKLIKDTEERLNSDLDWTHTNNSYVRQLAELFIDCKERLTGFKKSRNYLEMELELLGKHNRGKVSRMKNLVNLAFPSEKVDELDLVHSPGRSQLFRRLVSDANSLEEFSCLIEILRSAWVDGFASSAKENEWVLLFASMIKTQEGIVHEEIISVLKQLEEESKMLDSNCFFQIMKEAQKCGANMLYVRLGLLSKEANLQVRGATMIRKCEFEVDELDEEVLYLIFKRGLLPGFLKKRQFYDDAIAFLVDRQNDKTRPWPAIDVIAEQLKSTGNVKDAQELLSKHGGMLTGFKSALSLTAWGGWGKGSEQ